MSTLYTFWDSMIPYRTESVHLFGAYELSNEVSHFFAAGLRNVLGAAIVALVEFIPGSVVTLNPLRVHVPTRATLRVL